MMPLKPMFASNIATNSFVNHCCPSLVCNACDDLEFAHDLESHAAPFNESEVLGGAKHNNRLVMGCQPNTKDTNVGTANSTPTDV